MKPLLVIDLSKGRPAGSSNDEHAYIMRYRDHRGKWRYVPEGKEEWKKYGKPTPGGGYELKEGWTVAKVIRHTLLGEADTGLVKPQRVVSNVTRNGKTVQQTEQLDAPVVTPGRFVRYVVVPESQYRREVASGHNPYKGDPSDPSAPHPLSTQTVTVKHVKRYADRTVTGAAGRKLKHEQEGETRYFVFAYPKKEVVARDENGKAIRWAGMFGGNDETDVEFHDQAKGQGWSAKKLAQDIQQFRVTEPEHFHEYNKQVKRDPLPEKGFEARELPALDQEAVTKPKQAQPHPMPDGDRSLRTKLNVTDLMDLRVDDETDPFALARQVYDKVQDKLDKKVTRGGWARVLPFDQSVLAKFNGEQELLDKLQKQPFTTMVTLGIVRPSYGTRKFNDALVREWMGTIRRMAGEEFAGYRETEAYAKRVARDDDRRRHGLAPKAVSQFRGKIMSEKGSVGVRKLLDVALRFGAGKAEGRRFDSYATVAVSNAMKDHTIAETKHMRVNVPMVHEGMADQALRESGYMGRGPLSASEMMELHEVSGPAQATLHRVLSEMPDTYRQVLAHKHFLDEPDEHGGTPLLDVKQSAEEMVQRDRRQRKLGKEIREAALEGAVIARRNVDGTRPWTGPGGVAEKMGLDDMKFESENGKREWLKTLYRRAREHLVRQLTTPIHDPKRRDWHEAPMDANARPHPKSVEVSATREDLAQMTPEERIVHAATGTVTRRWTPEGDAVRRYLQLAPRGHWNEAEHLPTTTLHEDVQVKPAHVKIARHLAGVRSRGVKTRMVVAPTATKHQFTNQAERAASHVEFWVKHPDLAEKVGINLKHLGDTSAGLHTLPGLKHTDLGAAATKTLSLMRRRYAELNQIKAGGTSHQKLRAVRQALSVAETNTRDFHAPDIVDRVQNRNALRALVALHEHALSQTKKSLGPWWALGDAILGVAA